MQSINLTSRLVTAFNRCVAIHKFLLTLLACGSLMIPALSEARIVSREEALAAAFPGAKIEPAMIFLTETERKEISKISSIEITTALVARYVAFVNGKQSGRAYLDTHTVRTKKESLLVILHADGKVRRVEVVAFLEPPDYLPSDKWYEQFQNRELNRDLQVSAAIRGVTGATLTAHATTAAVRRVLATDQVLAKRTGGTEKKP